MTLQLCYNKWNYKVRFLFGHDKFVVCRYQPQNLLYTPVVLCNMVDLRIIYLSACWKCQVGFHVVHCDQWLQCANCSENAINELIWIWLLYTFNNCDSMVSACFYPFQPVGCLMVGIIKCTHILHCIWMHPCSFVNLLFLSFQ